MAECAICINSSLNPSTPIGSDGLCEICRAYNRNPPALQCLRDLAFLNTFKGGGKFDCMVGMSGGKDSSATAFKLKEMGFHPLGFTFDIGYYPNHIFSRAAKIADQIGIHHVRIDIRHRITQDQVESYRLTADAYDSVKPFDFLDAYRSNRLHYSVKDRTVMPFVRTCILCRKVVIPSYHAEALISGVRLVVLGINEWAGLSQTTSYGTFSPGIRRLQPDNQPAVFVAHLPFILSMTRERLQTILSQMKWKPPDGEDLIEASSNSCLFAAAAQEKARRELGFHPDTTRLAREVTVGFISKLEAKIALDKKSPSTGSVTDVLKAAGIL